MEKKKGCRPKWKESQRAQSRGLLEARPEVQDRHKARACGHPGCFPDDWVRRELGTLILAQWQVGVLAAFLPAVSGFFDR
jgi:hypothetical protein